MVRKELSPSLVSGCVESPKPKLNKLEFPRPVGRSVPFTLRHLDRHVIGSAISPGLRKSVQSAASAVRREKSAILLEWTAKRAQE